jgi:catechol 2,3-dioxygenase-like lactoylglutathione lyase family enzyme
MDVKGLCWLGLRTDRFDEMVTFFRDVMGMKPIRDEAQIAGFQISDGTRLELYRPEEKFHAFFTTGPVVAFREPPWKRQGSNSSALSNARARPVGITFALPTAPSSKF